MSDRIKAGLPTTQTFIFNRSEYAIDRHLALGRGELELEVLGEFLAAPVVHASRVLVGSVLEELVKLLAVERVAQRPGVRALVRLVARVLACTGRTLLVSLWLVVAPGALLGDGPCAVDCQCQ